MDSSANSFGIDAAIIGYYGQQLMARVQQMIAKEYFGEQPVGTCRIVPTEHPKHPWLAHTPTMRIPSVIRRQSATGPIGNPTGERVLDVFAAQPALLE